MNFGLCFCTTVLTVVSSLGTGCGVRLIYSCYFLKKGLLKRNTMMYIGHYNTPYQYDSTVPLDLKHFLFLTGPGFALNSNSKITIP